MPSSFEEIPSIVTCSVYNGNCLPLGRTTKVFDLIGLPSFNHVMFGVGSPTAEQLSFSGLLMSFTVSFSGIKFNGRRGTGTQINIDKTDELAHEI